MVKELENSLRPLDVLYNDIKDKPIENCNKEQAYKDIEIIADFIINIQSQFNQQKVMWNAWKEWFENEKKKSDF